MVRVKRGMSARKRRKKVIKAVKGYRWSRKSHYRAAKEALLKAGKYAYRDRRVKKRAFRRLWITRLNIALRALGLKYSQFVKLQRDKKNELNRKVLSQLAVGYPKVFEKLVEKLK